MLTDYSMKLQLPNISEKDVLEISKDGKVLIGGIPVTIEQGKQLREEAKALEHFALWKILKIGRAHV